MAGCSRLSSARGLRVARWASLGALLACLALWAPAAEAAITVNTTADPGVAGQCSLRKAILAANTQAPAGDCKAADPLPATTTIVLPAGHYSIHGQLEITGSANVAVQGASAANPSLTTIDAAHTDRVLMVDSGAQVSVSAVTLTGGQTPDGAAGTCCSPIGSDGGAGSRGGFGGDGGGVYNSGALILDHAVVTANATGRGGNGGPGGHGGNPPGGGGAGGGGNGGSGGGVFNDFNATLTLVNTIVSGNQAGAGGNGGIGGDAGTVSSGGFTNGGHGGNGAGGGTGGSGGGVKDFGTLTLISSTVRGNVAGDGGSGGVGGSGTLGNNGGDGGRRDDEGDFTGAGGSGGGIDEAGHGLTLTGTTISANAAGRGGAGATGGGGSAPGGIGGSGSPGGSGGSGGGVRLDVNQALSATNSTIAGNDAGYGGDGAAGGTGASQGSGGNGGNGGNGGAIFTNQATLTNATIANNRTHAGGHADGTGSTNGAAGTGAGIEDNGSGSVTLTNTLVASNAAPGGVQNCTAAAGLVIGDGGHDLSFGDTSCPGINGNPALGPLSNNGGPTQTMALGAASAAIDQIPAAGASCPGTDQRGQSRPFPAGGLCDIGAFEVGPPPRPSVSSVVPNAGMTAGGNTVTINGAHFVSGATVRFGSIASGTVTFVSATRLKAVAPAHAFGVVNVIVKTAPGTSATSPNDLYAYGPPTLSSFTPASGITGSLVTINGKNFVPSATVKFATKTSASVTFVSTTQLKAVVPNGAVAGRISVDTPAGTAMSASPFTPTLSITGFAPASGPPGTSVTIHGIGFNSSSKVKFNGIASAGVTHVSATLLKATVPATATTGPITVTNTKAPTGTVRSQTKYHVT